VEWKWFVRDYESCVERVLMADITSYGALSRHITEYLTTDKRVKYYKCKTLQNPDYCFNGVLYTPVDAAYKAGTVTRAGSISLASKGIVSVGIKNADDQYKFIGLRPDEKQDGTEQFEICPELLELNGKAQTIDLSTRTAISSITTKYGSNLYVQRARQRLRIMMLADDTCESFKMTLRLYLTGLNVEYMADLDEYWIFNTAGKFRFRLGKPYLVDPVTMNSLSDEYGFPYQNTVKHSLTEVAKGEYLYAKEADKGFAEIKLPKSFLIDADTVYSSTADGRVFITLTNNNSWTARRDAATGNGGSTLETGNNNGFGTFYLDVSGTKYYYLYRSFFYYSLAGLSGTATAVDENIYGRTNGNSQVCVQQGTQADTLTAADFGSFTGSEYFHTASNWSTSGYNTLNYNAQGISDVGAALGSTFKTCAREYTHDYLNSDAGTNSYQNGCYYADDTSGTKDPYLYVTMEGGGSPVFLPNIMKHNFIPPLIGGF
jgi:hypothetical protein